MAASSSSAARATAMASAAKASVRSSRSGQSRISPHLFAPVFESYKATKASWERADREMALMEEDESYDGLSARQRRLSRAARFGAATSSNEPVQLPHAWNTAVERLMDAADKPTLRQDYLRRQRGVSSRSMTPQRMSVLHLTSSSPQRYAAVRSVLRQVRNRIGTDQEDDTLTSLDGEWMPDRIVEYGCGAGEGLWASAFTFGNDAATTTTEESRTRLQYEGYDGRGPLLRVAAEIVEAAKIDSSTSLQNKGINDDNEANDVLRSLAGMQVSFAASQAAPKLGGTNEDTTAPEAEPSNGRRTLVVCNHSLSAMSSDTARNSFVKSLWDRHPTAEVLAFVEQGSERGFACIASAREELLGLGGGEGSERKQECHVVAPCPHDKPCPLLHDYEFEDGSQQRNSGVGRSQRASSPLFHGARIGLATCSSPIRVHVPNYSRLTRHGTRAEETVRHSYLIVRKGARPNAWKKAQEISRQRDGSTKMSDAWRVWEDGHRRAAKAKIGILEQLRAGTSLKSNIPLAEEITSDDIVQSSTLANVEAADVEDEKAKEELLRMLPEILQQQQEGQNDDDEADANVPEALRLAQSVLTQSAELGGGEQQTSEEIAQAFEEQQSLDMSSALLAQQRATPSEEQESMEEEEETPPPTVKLSKEDVESMRTESYEWPRLVRPAIKRSGHVVMDACTAQGSIDRFTLTRSMGKQMYQDARKVSHGDLIPYMPIVEEPVAKYKENGDAVFALLVDDEDGGFVQVQNVKSLIQCVPAASTTERNGMPTAMKIKQSAKAKKATRFVLQWPASSALAIGPDMVADEEARPTSTSTGKAETTTSSGESFSRRNHYTSGEGRGAEQLQRVKKPAYVARESRKRSIAEYADEVNEGWTLPSSSSSSHDEHDEEVERPPQ